MRVVNKRRFGVAIGVLVLLSGLVGYAVASISEGGVVSPTKDQVFELSEEDHMIMGFIHMHLNGLVCYNKEHENHGSRKAVKVLGYVESLVEDIETDLLTKDLSLLVTMLRDYTNGIVPAEDVKEHAAWMHRIAHDLDYQGMDGTKYYGATHALEGKSARAHDYYEGR